MSTTPISRLRETIGRGTRPKGSVFIATSLDGFIAREDGGLDWLPPVGDGEREDYGFAAFLDTVDLLVMGRNTFETVLGFGGPWPYGDKPVVVLSSRPVSIPAGMGASVEATSGPPAEVAERLAKRGATHLYVDGGKTIQRFLDAGLIHRLTITRVPVLIGRGIPLFGPISRDLSLRHVATRAFPNGLVQSTYEVAG